MGKINWWFPGWLDRRVPHLSIEGAEFFERRDQAVAEPREPVLIGSGAGDDD
jgi:RND superfamily putative drug exporter